MLDPAVLLAAYHRAGNWILPLVPARSRILRIGRCDVHVDLGHGRRRAYIGLPAHRPTLRQHALRLMLQMHPFAATWTDGYGGNATTYVDAIAHEGDPGSGYGSVTNIALGAASGDRARGLLKFDVTGVSGTINTATLSLFIKDTPFEDVGGTVRRILSANSAWTESANWNYAVPSSTRWAGDTGNNGGTDAGCSVSGTDYSATALGTWTITSSDTTGTEDAISLDATEFANLLTGNYGFVAWAATSWSYIQYCSSDHATTGYRPKLVVDYTAASAGGKPTYAYLQQ